MEPLSASLDFPFATGRNLPFTKTLQKSLHANLSKNFDFLITPLCDHSVKANPPVPFNFRAHPDVVLAETQFANKQDKLEEKMEFKALLKQDTPLEANQWRHIIAEIYQGNTDDYSEERKQFKKILKQEINYGVYLSVYAVLIPFPTSENLSNYARQINKFLDNALPFTEIWMRVPLEKKNCWEIYNSFRMNIKNTNGFGAFLEIPENLPEGLNRWYGENIKAIGLPANLFASNDKGLPVLKKTYEEIVAKVFSFKAKLVVLGKADEDLSAYRNSLGEFLKNQPKMSDAQKLESKYFDKVRLPLQPTKDNLEMSTYVNFEKDRTKYEIYFDAVKKLLHKNFKKDQKIFIIMIGPGRGPIMREIIKACIDNGFDNFKLHAIEKNPNAVITLENYVQQNQDYLKGRLTIVYQDIRKYQCEEKADMLVSELIGSFGCSELSPEVISAAERLLKKDGFCLPCQYTSYVSPLTSAHVYNKVCALQSMLPNPFEMGHVVGFHRHNLPSDIQTCFRFEHPFQEKLNFKRFKTLEFDFKEKNIIHGLAGYFDCYLFEDSLYSTCPLNKTEKLYGCFGWFPFFFPFEQPLVVHAKHQLKVNFWRQATNKKVWYEWQPQIVCKESKQLIMQLKIHNLDGKFHWMDK